MPGAINKDGDYAADGNTIHYVGDYILEAVEKTKTHHTFDVICNGDTIRTTVTQTASIVNDWIKDVRESFSDELENGNLVVGFDIEWVRISETNKRNDVSVLQLCLGDRCLIFQILLADKIPESLYEFLADEGIIFVGAGIEKEAHMLWVDYELYVARTEDLGSLADYKLGRDNLYKQGLWKLARVVLKLELPKPKSLTLSRWDIGEDREKKNTLSLEQVGYACQDAFASFKIGTCLLDMELPEPKYFKKVPQAEAQQGKVSKASNQEQQNRWADQDAAKSTSQLQGARAPNQDAAKTGAYNRAPNRDAPKTNEQQGSDMRPQRNEENSVRVSNLSYDAGEADLGELFGQFGELSRVHVVVNKESNKSRGFGFVHFVNKEDAEKAIEKLNGCCYLDRDLTVAWATPRGSEMKPPPRRNDGPARKNDGSVRVNNLPRDIYEADLAEVEDYLWDNFGKYGDISRVNVVVDMETGMSRGFGFVNFENKEDAAMAIEKLDGKFGYEHRLLRVGWARAN